MKKKKGIIDTYETIYSVDLVVAGSNTTLEQLKKLYTYADGEELDEGILDGCGTTSRCRRKSDDKYVILVKYSRNSNIKNIDKKLDRINTIAHEAGHVVLDIYDFIGQDVYTGSSELFCYLLGWVTECIYKTLQKE